MQARFFGLYVWYLVWYSIVFWAIVFFFDHGEVTNMTLFWMMLILLAKQAVASEERAEILQAVDELAELTVGDQIINILESEQKEKKE